jgi:hypothetical protein
MDSKSRFYALEVMSRERAALAQKEMEYWLNEAREWKQLGKATPALMPAPVRKPTHNPSAE